MILQVAYKFATLISELNFYKSIPYPCILTKSQNQGMLGHPGAVRIIFLHWQFCNFSTTLPKMAVGGKAYVSRSSNGRLSASIAETRGSGTGDTEVLLLPNQGLPNTMVWQGPAVYTMTSLKGFLGDSLQQGLDFRTLFYILTL